MQETFNIQDSAENIINQSERHMPNLRSRKGGMDAEIRVKKALIDFGCVIIENRIIWSRRILKSAEIDFIAYYKNNIILVEVKNWYGNIKSFDKDKWTIV